MPYMRVSTSKTLTAEQKQSLYEKLGAALAVIPGKEAFMLIADIEDGRQIYSGGGPSEDFVFIDAAKNHYREYWDQIMKLVSPGAVIVSDNVLLEGVTVSDEYLTTRRDRTSMMRMREYLDHITDLDGVYTSVLPVGDGVAVSILKRMG